MGFHDLSYSEVKGVDTFLRMLAMNDPSFLSVGSYTYIPEKVFSGSVVETDQVTHEPYLRDKPFSGSCPDTDPYFSSMLIRDFKDHKIKAGEYYKQGIVVVLDKIPLGIIKLKGNKLFLSGVTIRNSKGAHPLVKGGIYIVNDYLYNRLGAIEGKWRLKNVSEVQVFPKRMFTLSGQDFPYHLEDVEGRLVKSLEKVLEEAGDVVAKGEKSKFVDEYVSF